MRRGSHAGKITAASSVHQAANPRPSNAAASPPSPMASSKALAAPAQSPSSSAFCPVATNSATLIAAHYRRAGRRRASPRPRSLPSARTSELGPASEEHALMETRTDAEVIACSCTSPAVFSELFDRHATTMFRYFVRRVGPDDADTMLGELFRIAFEKRASFDTERAEARPWLYGIASNLLARHRQREARRLNATARLVNASITASDNYSDVDARVDATRLWDDVAIAIAALPQGERDALLLFAWEDMPYDQIATALDVPVGTVRSRLNRARGRLRELVGENREELMTSGLRPDRVLPVGEADPGLFKREKERLMSTIGSETPQEKEWRHTPAMYPRLTYTNEVAALDYLTRVFQFTERREARMGKGTEAEGMLAWLEFGDGVVMIGRATEAARDVHHLYSPSDVGHATVMINVAVDNIDAHYEHAVAEGATITMPIEDAFYGYRRYEADDIEGHHWHFHEPLDAVRAREQAT
jgi:RNA polymerase sigma-70 factor (ECF subfamily)